MKQNPLLVAMTELIDHARVHPDHIVPAIDELLAQARAAADRTADPALPATWEAVVEPLDTACERLSRSWAVAGHLNAVMNTPELRAAINTALPKVTEFYTWLGLHEGLYRQYQRLQRSPTFASWTPTRRRILELALRNFRLSGVELQGQARQRYAEISEQQAQASQKFSENVLDAIDAWSLLIKDETRLAGVPADVVAAAHQAAQEDGAEGFKLTLKMPCYLPVMQYADDRTLRATLYRAYGTVASEQGDRKLDNSPLIETLLTLRAETAALLGYDSFATLNLQTRMARNAEEVITFLRDLAKRAKPYAERDLAELKEFAARELDLADLQPWDVGYASERLRQALYAYSEDEVKQYFSEPRVLAGLFHIIEQLFNVKLREISLSTWHADVRGVRVETPAGDTIGYLYLDMYARLGKQGGAGVESERNRRLTDTAVHTPIVYLTCNFSPPHAGKPALLTHDDVMTLFHEAGHALHALLSEVNELGAAAFNSVEWDAIELPSQFMENFCWEWPVLQTLSSHVDTGEPLPRALYERMRAARNFQSGMQMVRQIEFALFDMLLHHRHQETSITQVLALLSEVRREVAVLIPPTWHRMPHSFSHLFAGGYAAGYYSYKWAEVLSADAYEAFEEAAAQQPDVEAAILNAQTGARFRREILAVGGARSAAESFVAFRGRPPRMDALLRHSGMTPQR
jgi:oligopeptidase A